MLSPGLPAQARNFRYVAICAMSAPGAGNGTSFMPSTTDRLSRTAFAAMSAGGMFSHSHSSASVTRTTAFPEVRQVNAVPPQCRLRRVELPTLACDLLIGLDKSVKHAGDVGEKQVPDGAGLRLLLLHGPPTRAVLVQRPD